MKTIFVTVQIKIDESYFTAKDSTLHLIEDLVSNLETPIIDKKSLRPVNHLAQHGYEIMIMNRSDR